jgi:hypothetical protein
MEAILKNLVVAATLGAGAASAFCWVMSAKAEVAAKPDTAGFGALLGGDIVIKNAAGQRIDLIDTIAMQSKWNRWAAVFAAIATGAQVLAVVPI